MKLLNTLALVAILGFTGLQASNYKVDSAHSEVGFKVKHMIISSIKGNFKTFKGSYTLN